MSGVAQVRQVGILDADPAASERKICLPVAVQQAEKHNTPPKLR